MSLCHFPCAFRLSGRNSRFCVRTLIGNNSFCLISSEREVKVQGRIKQWVYEYKCLLYKKEIHNCKTKITGCSGRSHPILLRPAPLHLQLNHLPLFMQDDGMQKPCRELQQTHHHSILTAKAINFACSRCPATSLCHKTFLLQLHLQTVAQCIDFLRTSPKITALLLQNSVRSATILAPTQSRHTHAHSGMMLPCWDVKKPQTDDHKHRIPNTCAAKQKL